MADENDGEVNDEWLHDNIVAENGTPTREPWLPLELELSSTGAEESSNEEDSEPAILGSPGANIEIDTRELSPSLESEVSSTDAEESSNEQDPEAAILGSPGANMEVEIREPFVPDVSSIDAEEPANEAVPAAAISPSPTANMEVEAREPVDWSSAQALARRIDPLAAFSITPPPNFEDILAHMEANRLLVSTARLNRIENPASYRALESAEDESPEEIVTVDLSHSPPIRTSPLTTPRRKKRKRTVTPQKTVRSPAAKGRSEDDDSGSQCSICLDDWTISGNHRVVSLKCGHLFGLSCITQWLESNWAQQRCCATCKTKASLRDIRPIYAKAIRGLDTAREDALASNLAIERDRVTELRIKLGVANSELAYQRRLTDQYKAKLDGMNAKGDTVGVLMPTERPTTYMLHMDKNIEISPEPGCRVMAYAAGPQILLISLKSTQVLFPGYAVRMLRGPEFTAVGTVLVSSQSIRDIAVDAADALFACATMEQTVKVFSIEQRSIKLTITPNPEACVWSCAFDKERPTCLYLGTLRGSVYVYDIRQPERCLKEFQVGYEQNDFTAVIRICPVEPTPTVPFGGFLVCKLKSLWFFEYTASEQVTENRLNLEGPFWSMSYNADSRLILVTQRVTRNGQRTTHVLGMLEKLGDVFSLAVHHKFEGSQVQTTMLRNAQLLLPNGQDTLVASFLEDDRKLATWSTNCGPRPIQKLQMGDTILDICPVKLTPHQTHVATLCGRRCRIYHVESAK